MMMKSSEVKARGTALVMLEHAFGWPLPKQITKAVVDEYAALVAAFHDDVVTLPAIEDEYTRRIGVIYAKAFGSREQAEAHAQRRLSNG